MSGLSPEEGVVGHTPEVVDNDQLIKVNNNLYLLVEGKGDY